MAIHTGVHSTAKEGEMEKILAVKPYRMGVLIAVVVAAALALSVGSVLAAGPLVDINTADQKALESLPGVGPVMAKAIIQGRPYKSVDDLANVKGIGKSKLEKIKPLVTVGGPPAAQVPAAAGAAAPKAATTTQAPQKAPAEAKKAGKVAVPAGPININTASKEQLDVLPGIGKTKAQAIIDGRPYQKPEDIMKVKGIKQKTYDKIKDMITVQ
jgi:competence protein ComEA